MREIDGGRPIGEVARIKFRSVVQFLLYMGTKRDLRIPCSRETMQSIRESVHQLLEDQITRLGLQRFLRGSEGRDYRPAYETSFTFHSLRDQTAHNIKSTEGANVLWVEEAQSVSKKSWRTVIPTIRKPGSEIWISFNPELETDETYRRFMVSSRAGCCRSEVIGDRRSPPTGLRVPKPIEDSTESWTLTEPRLLWSPTRTNPRDGLGSRRASSHSPSTARCAGWGWEGLARMGIAHSAIFPPSPRGPPENLA